MFNAPVLEASTEPKSVIVVSLNPLPEECSDLASYIEEDGLAQLMTDHKLLYDIYHCNILPLERKPISDFLGPITDDGQQAPLFGELNFEKVPITVQPKLCLANWLRARGIDARLIDSREVLMDTVKSCCRVNKKIYQHSFSR